MLHRQLVKLAWRQIWKSGKDSFCVIVLSSAQKKSLPWKVVVVVWCHPDFHILRDEKFLSTKVWHHNKLGLHETASEYVAFSSTCPWRHFMPFHWGCLTICHTGMWSDALRPSCCQGFPPHSIVFKSACIWPPGGPCCKPELRPSISH